MIIINGNSGNNNTKMNNNNNTNLNLKLISEFIIYHNFSEPNENMIAFDSQSYVHVNVDDVLY